MIIFDNEMSHFRAKRSWVRYLYQMRLKNMWNNKYSKSSAWILRYVQGPIESLFQMIYDRFRLDSIHVTEESISCRSSGLTWFHIECGRFRTVVDCWLSDNISPFSHYQMMSPTKWHRSFNSKRELVLRISQ